MSQQDDFSNDDPKLPLPLDLSKWRTLPVKLMIAGVLIAILGVGGHVALHGGADLVKQFGYAWLVAFMFCLSLGLGSLFLVIVHHQFYEGWSVATRRTCEHLASLLFPTLFVLWLPIGILAPKLYEWMGPKLQANPDHALAAKEILFNYKGFYLISIACFAVWWWFTNRLKYWSIKQDTASEKGNPAKGFMRFLGVNQNDPGVLECTLQMRKFASFGVFFFAFSLTFGAIMWMKALHHQWFSTMYGVCYFAGSVWLTLATVYVITMIMDRQRILTEVLHEHQFYFLGSLLFAFTVFYAYVTFSQYFIIWNANMPEETFYYVIREHGTWFLVSMVIIFGHFFAPFLTLLRIDVKQNVTIMLPLAAWAWLMHFFDMAFQIWPYQYRAGFPILWAVVALGIISFMVGVLATVFLKMFNSAPPFPQKDPRLVEAMGLYHPVPTPISGGELGQAEEGTDHLIRPKTKGGH